MKLISLGVAMVALSSNVLAAGVTITVTNEPAGDTVSQTWSFTLGVGTDAGMTCQFANATAVDTTITCDDDGTVTVKLTVSDGVNPPVEALDIHASGNGGTPQELTVLGSQLCFGAYTSSGYEPLCWTGSGSPTN